MTDKIYVLGNQEEKKLVNDLLRRASKDKVIDKVVRGKEETPESAVKPDLSITSEGDFWRISGVKYRNGVYTVDLLKELLDSGNKKRQASWAGYSIAQFESGDFGVWDLPLYHSLFTTIYMQRDRPEAEEARKFIEEQIKNEALMTLTRIMYNPKGKDTILHNYGSTTNYRLALEENIAGKRGYISRPSADVADTVLGTKLVHQVEEVYSWIELRDPVILAMPSKPEKVEERAAWISNLNDGVCLNLNGDADLDLPALGVRIVGKEK